MTHAVAQAGRPANSSHIDLNDQVPGRYDQDLRFGSANPRAAFWLVKFLEDVGYEGRAPSTRTHTALRITRESGISPAAVCEPI